MGMEKMFEQEKNRNTEINFERNGTVKVYFYLFGVAETKRGETSETFSLTKNRAVFEQKYQKILKLYT